MTKCGVTVGLEKISDKPLGFVTQPDEPNPALGVRGLRTSRRFPELPVVTVQLPIFNEQFVIDRLIEAVCAMEYPREKLEIQVLDDSTDETTEVAAGIVARYADEWDVPGITSPTAYRARRERRTRVVSSISASRNSISSSFSAVLISA
jgi:cellulose synthase/poly-beta-1,6-N-acetylglucosamine synthase-like glycosyltransferase